MPEVKQQKNKEILNNKPAESYSDFEARQNLFGFFSLLLEIDKRINPHLYKKTKNNENNGSPNNPNKT